MAPPKKPTPWDEWEARKQQRAADAAAAAQAPPPAATGWPDPVTNVMGQAADFWEHMTPAQRAYLGMPPGPTPDWLKFIGRHTLPQDTVDLAVQAAMMPVGGPIGSVVGKGVVAPFVKKGLAAGAKRALGTGGLASLVGLPFGKDPLESFERGVVGRTIGETLGNVVKGGISLAKAAKESKLAKDISGAVTSKMTDAIRTVFGDWLPEGKITDQQVLREVIADRLSKRVGAAINRVKAAIAQTPVKAADLKAALQNNQVDYAWPTQAGSFPKQIGPAPPTIQGGNVWPRPRTFESKLTPGEGLEPYGALESSPRRIGAGEPGGALEPTGGEVALGPLWDAVETALQRTEQALTHAPNDAGLLTRWQNLTALRETLADRVQTPELKGLLKEYGQTKSIRDFFMGKRFAGADYGDKVLERLIDPKTGNISAEGAALLHQYHRANMPNVEDTLGERTWSLLGDALGIREHMGLAHPTVGGVPKAGVSVGLTGPKPHVSMEGSPFATHPSAKVGTTPVQELAPGAVKAVGALGGSQAADALLGPTPASAEEGPTAPPTVSIPPERLRDPYSLNIPLPKGGQAPAPAPVLPPPPAALRAPSPEASSPQAGMQGAGFFPRFDEQDADQPEVTLEVTKKAGE